MNGRKRISAIQCTAIVRPLPGGFKVIESKDKEAWIVCGDNCSVRVLKRDDLSSVEKIRSFALLHFTAAEWFK